MGWNSARLQRLRRPTDLSNTKTERPNNDPRITATGDANKPPIQLSDDSALSDACTNTPLAGPSDEPEYVTGAKLYIIVTALTAIPQNHDRLQVLEDIGWYGWAYNFSSAAA
ncbi:hypothetical protein B0T26DRAFT_745269 [Lasiosphaeria miniovina]|uniref:Uncharacterized protein n=1 Tax=Lasiosphaeria miniovina TaxID=1954250 RepID=A0AA40BFF1_9PEZI|nr:uncharacterized protein B0T26DRAFT_745269 [Lasiosphaeria miniovina]KAK0733196.1 hypothetical protein B0T26DRAFT_745269 [Lasiosphaeria miniovina]